MDDAELSQAYYLDLAAAYVRGLRPDCATDSPAATFHAGVAAGLRLHRFKRTAGLPRVRRVLGILRGLAPSELLDIGTGRGAFLWPLLDAYPGLPVLAVDNDPHRTAVAAAVRAGGVGRLTAVTMDATRLGLADRSFDVATALEVLEHLARPDRAVAELARVARRAVVASVPSRPDDNPEHVQLFTKRRLEALFHDAGFATVRIDAVLNHYVLVATGGER
ncbi:MAG: class I SAM-dependent methyltransferase [Gemmataceae bacterium]